MGKIHKCGFIAGCSGIGKGFGCGAVLEEYFPVRIFTTGDWCRKHAADKAAAGILVNDAVIQQACEEDFREFLAGNTGRANLLVDAPRTPEQFYSMVDMFVRLGGRADQLVTFGLHSVEEHIARERLYERARRQGRADDRCTKTCEVRIDTCYGTPIDPQARDKMIQDWQRHPENHLLTPRNVPRKKTGLVHTLFPLLKKKTNFRLINADCLEDMRHAVQHVHGPALLG